jgi:hypothetical protein
LTYLKSIIDKLITRHRFDSTSGASPGSFRNFLERRLAAGQVIRAWTGVAAEQLPAFLADSTELHVFILLVHVLLVNVI